MTAIVVIQRIYSAKGGPLACMHALLKMSCYSNTTICQYWDNCLVY